MVGDLWLAFVGPKMQRGATGLGQTPRDALTDFNRHFMEPIISSNGSEPDSAFDSTTDDPVIQRFT
jgi:hypothetical protein